MKRIVTALSVLVFCSILAFAQQGSAPLGPLSGSGLPIGAAGGDLSGTYPNPTVSKIQSTTPGTGVVTALGVNVGSAGAIVVNGGALGTPSSGTLTNATGLPISSGISGLGSGVGTALSNATNATGGPVTAATSCTSWTPTDQSGASLTFTAVSAQYCQYGNIVIVYGTLTYPTTADGSSAKISLPVAVPNQPYASVFGTADGQGQFIKTVINSSIAAILTAGGVAATNATLSTKIINIFVVYPAS